MKTLLNAIRRTGSAVSIPRMGKTPAHWLFEALFILASVGLAFGVEEFRESRANKELAARVLRSLQAEVEHNLAVLAPLAAVHAAWVEALEKADSSSSSQTGLEVMFAARPALPAGAKTPFPSLRRSAWDAAMAGGALRLIDYEVTGWFSDIYRVQDIVTGNINRLAAGALTSTASFDPGQREPAIRLLLFTLRDIQTAEAALLELYRQHLPKIRAANGAS